MMKYLLLAALALALVAGCGGTKSDKELGQSSKVSTDTKTPEGDDSSTGGGESGTVQSEVLAALKTIYFDFDKYNLRDDAKRTLEGNAKVLMANPRARIVIEGHCDERGTTEYNLALGERRASTARDYLIRLGVAASQISIISYGEERPVSLGHDEDSWATNRRGEFGPR